MHDERIERDLSIIKRNIHFVWLVIPVVTIAVRLFIFQDFDLWGIVPEIVLILGTVFSILRIAFRQHGQPKDERIEGEALHAMNRSFSILIAIVVFAYFLRMAYGSTPSILANLFINLFLSVTFYTFYASAIHRGIYFNHRAIEDTKANYWKHGIFTMAKIILFFGLTYLVIYGLSFVFTQNLSMKHIAGNSVVSTAILIIQYALLTLFERIQYSENRKIESNYRIILSRVGTILAIVSLVFSTFLMLLYGWSFFILQSEGTMTPLYHQINALHAIAQLLFFDIALLSLVGNVFFYRTLVKQLPEDRHNLKRWFSFRGVLIFLGLLNTGSAFIIPRLLNGGEEMVTYQRIMSYYGAVTQLLSLILVLLGVLYLWKRGYQFVKWTATATLVSFLLGGLVHGQLIIRYSYSTALIVSLFVSVLALGCNLVFYIQGIKARPLPIDTPTLPNEVSAV
ncbi:MAG: hypothetical protein MZU97_25620 [Bacillus subtilis]|nr:hypothetical protein [Bacillus subtilis]